MTADFGMDAPRRAMAAGLSRGGIYSGAVIGVMARVPRHLFVSEALRYRAYDDISLPIGFGQTLSRPRVIALMVQGLNLTGDERVMEIGTGSGYQSAVLAELAGSVITFERIESLYRRARDVLFSLDYANVRPVFGDDFREAEGPFDAIVVAAGAKTVPGGLIDRLSPGGRLVIPLQDGHGHRIMRFIRKGNSVIEEGLGTATFVPYVGSESA